MSIYFEVRSSSNPDGNGEKLEPSRYSTREEAEAAARRESAMGFFSAVFEVHPGSMMDSYLCEYAPPHFEGVPCTSGQHLLCGGAA